MELGYYRASGLRNRVRGDGVAGHAVASHNLTSIEHEVERRSLFKRPTVVPVGEAWTGKAADQRRKRKKLKFPVVRPGEQRETGFRLANVLFTFHLNSPQWVCFDREGSCCLHLRSDSTHE